MPQSYRRRLCPEEGNRVESSPVGSSRRRIEGAEAQQLKMSSFFFTKVPPEEQMYTDIKSLNKFDEKAFCQLVDIVFSFLVSPKEGTRLMSQVSEFAGEHGVSTNALKNVVKSLLGFFKSALKSNLTPAQVKEDLEHLGKTDHDKHNLKNRVRRVGWGNVRFLRQATYRRQPTLIYNIKCQCKLECSRVPPPPFLPPGNDSLSVQGSGSLEKCKNRAIHMRIISRGLHKT